MKKLIIALVCISLLGMLNAGCRKSRFYIKQGEFTHLPIALNEFTVLVPRGFTSPPGHVFPNDHMAFYYAKDVVPVTIYSPGNLRITEIKYSQFTNPFDQSKTEDYSLTFGVNGKSTLVFGHISELSGKLKSAFGNLSGTSCEEYPTGNGWMVKSCEKKVSVDVSVGEIIGLSNKVFGQQALDMGVYVNNVSVSPLDYFDATTRAQLESRVMGGPNAYHEGIKRTTLPIGGEANQDIAGTLQGVWLLKGFPKFPESKHIAFVKDYILPEELQISLGNNEALAPFSPGVWNVNLKLTGEINRPFAEVKSNGKIYCYELSSLDGTLFDNRSLIVKLETNTTMYLENRDCDCNTNLPYQFTAAKITYIR